MSEQADKDIVRGLADQVAEIAALSQQAETIDRWTRLNDLKPLRPLVYVYQIPWREMDVDDELALQATDDFARGIEWGLRERLYRWKHMPCDMVVTPFYAVGMAIQSTGIGVRADVETIAHDENGGVNAQHFTPVIENEDDLEKIKTPVLTLDKAETEARCERTRELLGDSLPVKLCGQAVHNYAPWDRLAEWCNPQQVLMDLIMRPEFIHKAMDRLTSAYMAELDQLEELDVLAPYGGPAIVGQGGYGYSSDLPLADHDPAHTRLCDQWGGAMAQIFSEVSPDMHEEFALQYESRYLKRFGLSYYGCCEPLDRKVDICAKHIPNLRKISMSPWVDPKRGAEAINGRFVFSFKPNPAFLATDGQWDKASAEKEIQAVLEATDGAPVEFILKDVSTVRFEPHRLWEWSAMVTELVSQYE